MVSEDPTVSLSLLQKNINHNVCILFFLICASTSIGISQNPTPFTCTEQFYVVRGGNEIALASIDPSNSNIRYDLVAASTIYTNMSIGFNPADGLIYGVCNFRKEMFRVGANGVFEQLINLNLSASEDIISAEVLEFGKYLGVFVSSNEVDQELLLIDLQSGNFDTQTQSQTVDGFLSDFAQDPYQPSVIFGFDRRDGNPVRYDRSTRMISNFPPIDGNNFMEGIAFDAFGDVYAFGAVEGGIASGLFLLNQQTNVFNRLATGPETFITDVASCPYTLSLRNESSLLLAFPCDTVEFSLTIANASRQSVGNQTLELNFPENFEIVDVIHDGNVSNISINDDKELEIKNIIPRRGLDTITVLAVLGNLEQGDFFAEASLTSSSGIINADDPNTIPRPDPTRIRVRAVNDEELTQEWFICIGDSIQLDARPFGSSFIWEDGSGDGLFTVSSPGTYLVTALSGCESFEISFEVETATCPFSIAVAHSIIPNESLRCSEVEFQYIIENDSGVSQSNVSFSDEMPPGFTIIAVDSNAIGGVLMEELLPDRIMIENAVLKPGINSIILRVEVGDILPGTYSNVAILEGLQESIGPNRVSFDPDIPGLDSTRIEVLGTVADTIFVDVPLCNNSAVSLDGTPFGVDFQWFDGSNQSFVEVDQLGMYELEVFSGCENSYVFFNVIEAENVDININGGTTQVVNLGDSIQLIAGVQSDSSDFTFNWIDPSGVSASCLDCLNPTVFPLQTTTFTLIADNGTCRDSSTVTIVVDKTRRLYIPDAFAPNSTIGNERFSIESPQFLEILAFNIFDRWGNQLFHGATDDIRNNQIYWDGNTENGDALGGIYYWTASLRFLDNEVESFDGEVLLLR